MLKLLIATALLGSSSLCLAVDLDGNWSGPIKLQEGHEKVSAKMTLKLSEDKKKVTITLNSESFKNPIEHTYRARVNSKAKEIYWYGQQRTSYAILTEYTTGWVLAGRAYIQSYPSFFFRIAKQKTKEEK